MSVSSYDDTLSSAASTAMPFSAVNNHREITLAIDRALELARAAQSAANYCAEGKCREERGQHLP